MRILFAFLLLLFFVLSSPVSIRAQAFGYDFVRIPEGIGVIVHEQYGPDAFSEAEGYWTPTADEVRQAEELIVSIRGSEPPDVAPGPEVDLLEFASRQYFGLVDDGAQTIYINGFCTGGLFGDPTQLMIVMDGGACFWQATIDTETWEVIRYYENGDA